MSEEAPRRRRAPRGVGSVSVSFVTKAGAKGAFRCSLVVQGSGCWTFRSPGKGDRGTLRHLYVSELASLELTGPLGLIEQPVMVPYVSQGTAQSPYGPQIHNPRSGMQPTIQQMAAQRSPLQSTVVGGVPMSQVEDENGNVGVFPAGFMPS